VSVRGDLAGNKFCGSKCDYWSVVGMVQEGGGLGRLEEGRVRERVGSDVADSLDWGILDGGGQRTVEYLSKEVSESDFSKNYEKSVGCGDGELD
jgi:hypothetical protein